MYLINRLFNRIKKTFFIVVITYVVAEIIISTLFYYGAIEGNTIYFHESTDINGNFQFDTISGYKLSNIPARFGCYVENGSLQSHGVLKGNNLGFPSKFNFSQNFDTLNKKIIVVLGDSFSSSQFTPYSWVDKFQEYINNLEKKNVNIELWNMSVDGGGLANWWSIIVKLLKSNNYNIDGIIFANSNNDLDRGLMIRYDTIINNEVKHALYSSFDFDISKFPKTKSDFSPFYINDWKVLDKNNVDYIFSNKKNIKLNNCFQLRLYNIIFNKGCYYLSNILLYTTDYLENGPQKNIFLKSQVDLIQDIKDYAIQNNIPVLVLDVDKNDTIKSKEFVKLLNADYINGCHGLYSENLSKSKIKNLYHIKNDGHWNQNGIDNFTDKNKDKIYTWINYRILINKNALNVSKTSFKL